MAQYEPYMFIEFTRNGRTHTLQQRVTDFEYVDSTEETDMLNLTIEDIVTDLIDHPDLIDDGHTTVQFYFGYIGNVSPKRQAILSYLKPSFPQGAPITLQLKAHDLGLFMQKGKRTKVWERKQGYKPCELAQEIGALNGLRVEVTPCHESTRRLRWTQGNETDLAFLKKIAESATPASGRKTANYLVYISDDTLHFSMKKVDQAVDFSFTYFPRGDGDLLSFEPEIQEKKESDTVETKDAVKAKTTKKNSSNTTRDSLGKSDVNAGEKSSGTSSTNKGNASSSKRVIVNAETGEITYR